MVPLLIITTAVSAAEITMRWIDYSYVFAGFNLCNNATGVCRSLGHWVYSVSPNALTNSVVSGAAMSMDGGAFAPAQPGNFEAHICNGQCGNTSDASSCTWYKDAAGQTQLAQVWNWGYDSIFAAPAPASPHLSASTPVMNGARAVAAAAAAMPKQICIKAWALDENTGDRGVLPAACNDFPLTTFHAPLDTLGWTATFLYSLSAEVATYMCTSSFCRTNVHNSWDVSLPDPTNVLVAATEYAIDGGAWGSASGITFFEQKVKRQGGLWYHTFSWNYDVISVPSSNSGRSSATPAPRQICFRAWVQNRVSGETAWLDFGEHAQPGRPTTERCIKFCDHAMPFSYAPQAGGYCAPEPTTPASNSLPLSL